MTFGTTPGKTPGAPLDTTPGAAIGPAPRVLPPEP